MNAQTLRASSLLMFSTSRWCVGFLKAPTTPLQMWQKPSCSPASSLSFRTVSFILLRLRGRRRSCRVCIMSACGTKRTKSDAVHKVSF